MWARYAAWALAVGILAGCAGSSQEAGVAIELHKLGSIAKGSVAVAGKRVPLEKGEWTVIGTGIKMAGNRGFHVSYMIVNVVNRTVTKAVEIFTNLSVDQARGNQLLGDSGGAGWVTHRSCVRDDMHYKEVVENVRLGRQDCWWVNHWRMHRSGASASEHWTEARNFLEENSITAPLDMVGVSFRLANKRDYLTVNYFFSPKVIGQISSNDVYWNIRNWMTSDWHPKNVKKDPKKISFIKDLVAWGKGWHEKVKNASGID